MLIFVLITVGKRVDGGGQEQAKEGKQKEGDLGEDSSEGTTSGKCTDVGGKEPADTWFTALTPIAEDFGEVSLPPTDPRFVDSAPSSRIPKISGMGQDSARERLRSSGFQVADQVSMVNSTSPAGTVIGTSPSGQIVPGMIVTILVSNGVAPPPPPPHPSPRPSGY